MHANPLTAYLNDHLAGSVAGINLADTLATTAARANDCEHALWLTTLRDALQSAQADLRDVMRRSQAPEAVLKQVGSRIAERMTRVRLALTSATEGSRLAWLEGLEALALGLQGQAALWRALDATFAPDDPRRGATDFTALEHRAQMLFTEVDHARLAAAAIAFF